MKKIIDKEYTFDLKDHGFGFTIGMILDCKELLPTDKIKDFNRVARQYSGWGGGQDDEPGSYTVPVITITRREEESDQDYFERMKKEEQYKKQVEEKERLEYLRLKAKFES